LQKLIARLFRGWNTADADIREKIGIIGGAFGLVINALIFVMEICVGTAVNSVAITADAFHNLTDVVSSLITIFSFRISNKPADKEHPFGHGRMEYLSSLIVAMVIIVIGYEFIKASIGKILHPSDVIFNLVSLCLVLAAIPLKMLLSGFNKRLGNLINSSALKASSFDAFSDVLVLSVSSLSLILSAFTKVHIDGFLGVIVALFIMYSGFSIAKKELNPLLGEAPDPELVRSISEGVMKAEYVTGVHDLIIHNYGPGKFMATIHAEVPCEIPILSVHDSIDRVEKELSEQLGIILVVHMDPLNNNDEVVKKAKNITLQIIADFRQIKSIHDFRVVGDGRRKNLIFDVVVDTTVRSKSDEQKLKAEIGEKVSAANKHYFAVINVDRNYTSP
jgi:cation diffusion facilitator family transporter